ncbi:MAG: polysaccharide biosynthesis tyrosine autokinase [Pseudomonadota bacterium]
MAVTEVGQPQPTEFDFAWFLAVAKRYKVMIALIGIVIGAVTAFMVLSNPVVYRAETRIFFEGQSVNVLDADDVIARQQFGRDALDDQTQLMLSKSLLEDVIRQEGLLETAEFNPLIEREPSPMMQPILLALEGPLGAVRASLIDWGLLSDGSDEATELGPEDEAQLMAGAVEAVRGNMVIGRASPRVLAVQFVSVDPERAAAVVNAITATFLAGQLQSKIDAARDATTFLSERSQQLAVRLREAEATVQEARAELNEIAGQSAEATKGELEVVSATLSQRRSELPRLKARVEQAEEVIANGNLGSFEAFRLSAEIREQRDRLSVLENQRDTLARSVPEGHPSLLALDRQIADAQKIIGVEAAQIVDSLRNEYATAEQTILELTTRLAELEQIVLIQSRSELRVRQLEREAESLRTLYESILRRLKEATEQQDLLTSDGRVITEADPPQRPEAGKRKIIVAAASVAGLALGFGLAILLEITNRRFRHPNELMDQTGYAVLGSLPKVRSRRRADLLAKIGTKRGKRLYEAVQELRTNILMSNIDDPPRIVMVTSAEPRAGKSTTSMLLAQAAAQMGRRTILVECDLRCPVVASFYEDGDKNEPGIISLINGTATLEEAVFHDDASGLDVLAVQSKEKRTMPNAPDILASRRFRNILNDLLARYDFVVLDTPPVLAVADATIVAPMADAVVLAVRWREAVRDAVLDAVDRLHRVKAPFIGFCMTCMNERKVESFARGQYGYAEGEYRRHYM